MTKILIEKSVIEQALEALERWKEWDERTQQEMHDDIDDAAITALREALAEQAEQEPVSGSDKRFTSDDVKVAFENGYAAGVSVSGVAKEAEQEPVAEHELIDIRCGCCGYMTYHREHMGCIKAAAPVRTKDLTDDEIERALDAANVTELPDGYKNVDIEIARAGIAADREKNRG